MIIHDASEPVSRARLVAFARRFRGACLRRFGARMPRSLRIRDVRWGGGPVSPASAVPQLRIPGYGRPGASASGRQRFKCSACGRRCNSLTGTVLEFGEKDLPVWVDFINLMRFGMPLKGIAANRGVSRPTAFEWRRLVFEAVDGLEHETPPFERSRARDAAVRGYALQGHAEPHEVDEVDPDG